MKPEKVGTVEMLRARVLPLDGETPEPQVKAIVPEGVYPLYCEAGVSYFWLMEGELNGGRTRNLGDGLIVAVGSDVLTGVSVRFPSKRFGPEAFARLRDEPLCREGDEQQRLRIILDAEVAHA